MPRAKVIESEEAEKKPVRKPRAKKTTARTTANTKTSKRATTKSPNEKKIAKPKTSARKKSVATKDAAMAEKNVAKKTVTARTTKQSSRKAPTKFAGEQAQSRLKRTQYIVIGSVLLFGIGASAAVGFADAEAGKINVAKTIEERNARMANMVDVDGPITVAPVPKGLPDGGLIGLQPTAVPAAAPLAEVGTSTATTTDAVIEDTASATTTPATRDDTSTTTNVGNTVTATTSVQATTSGVTL